MCCVVVRTISRTLWKIYILWKLLLSINHCSIGLVTFFSVFCCILLSHNAFLVAINRRKQNWQYRVFECEATAAVASSMGIKTRYLFALVVYKSKIKWLKWTTYGIALLIGPKTHWMVQCNIANGLQLKWLVRNATPFWTHRQKVAELAIYKMISHNQKWLKRRSSFCVSLTLFGAKIT